MYFYKRCFALVFASALVSLSTEANGTENCVQSEDVQLRIDACTAEIISGRWPEQEIGWAHYNRGIAYLLSGQYQLAIADFNRADDVGTVDAVLYSNRGIAHWYLEDYERAMEDQERSINLDPTYAAAFNNRGLVYSDLGKFELAISDHKRAIELDPNNIEAIDNLGLAYVRIDDFKRGIHFREQAMLLWGPQAIREWQTYLKETGHYAGPANGVYDDATRAAFAACAYAKC